MSTLFLRTLRDNPADAEVASHKLLVRAGYIRRVSPGIYSWLPLGMRVLQNIEKIVRDEMNHFGAQEIHLPALLPREPYEVTGRWTEYGDNLFRLKDRKDNDMLLGPTHEEMFAGLVKSEFTSYKDFPVVLYQIQTKYRDEERPRAGILRGREFVMKDSYSFDMDDAGLEKAYQDHRVAYQNIFDRLGVDYAICSATSGAMGGSASEEFLAVAASGEDTFVRSTESDYAANVEAVKIPSPPVQDASSIDAAKIYETQNTPTIQTLVDWANKENVLGRNATAQDTLKNIVVKVHAPGEDEARLTAIAIPGDREVDFKRLEAAFEPSVVTLAEDKDFADNPFLVKGYIGPKALRDNDVPFYVDPRVVDGTAWITGADQPGKHYVNLVMGRDFDADGILDVANIVDGDPSPDGQGTLTLERGIEIGHIFQLGRKYTDAFEVDILDQNGKRARPTMGSYGLGVTRLIGVLAEQMHDDAGLRWPVSVAPFQVHIVIANKDDDVAEAAAELAESLDYAGVSVLLDDRLKVSPGVKFKDAELIGNPYVVVVGRGLADGTVELRERLSGEKTEVAYNEIQDVLASKLSEQA